MGRESRARCRADAGACIYCGREGPLTLDHIPPRALFAEPRPADLITVPSCQPCNVGFSKDDEYLRLVLTLKHDSYPHPS